MVKSKQQTRLKPGDPYHHGDLRAGLLRAVEELLGEVGVEALTLRACARRAGVSHSAPAHHFGNLQGLLTAFAVQGFQRLAAAMDAAASTSVDDLYGTGLGYIRFAMQAPQQFRLMWSWGVLDMTAPALLGAIEGSRTRLLQALVGANLNAHQVLLPEAVLAARFSQAWCAVHGYACLWVEGVRYETLPNEETFLMAMRPGLLERPQHT